MDDEESSIINTFVGVAFHHNWVSSSLEPTLADSLTGCSNSKSYSRELENPVGF